MDSEKKGSKDSIRHKSNVDNLSQGKGFSLQPPPLQLKPSDDEKHQSLPFRSNIESAFGSHDVSNVSPSLGGEASNSSKTMGATAYATENKVAFNGTPDLHSVAHEAIHIIQSLNRDGED